MQIVNAILTELPRGVCGEADEVRSQTVSTTHGRLHRPVLSWTCKPNGGIHAQLKRIGKSSGGMTSAAKHCPARVLRSGRGGLPALWFALSLFSSHAAVCHSSWTQHFVCMSVSGACPSSSSVNVVSLRASDAALPHLPPAVGSVPPLCLHPYHHQ